MDSIDTQVTVNGVQLTPTEGTMLRVAVQMMIKLLEEEPECQASSKSLGMLRNLNELLSN